MVKGGDRALNPKLGGRSHDVTNLNSNARSDSFILLLTISQKRTIYEVYSKYRKYFINNNSIFI